MMRESVEETTNLNGVNLCNLAWYHIHLHIEKKNEDGIQKVKFLNVIVHILLV